MLLLDARNDAFTDVQNIAQVSEDCLISETLDF